MIAATPKTREQYAALIEIYAEAFSQAAEGKGKERHASAAAFEDQPIMRISARAGWGFPLGQTLKKTEEALGMLQRGDTAHATFELLGAINYLAAGILAIRAYEAATEKDHGL